MSLFHVNTADLDAFAQQLADTTQALAPLAIQKEELAGLQKLAADFELRRQDVLREGRKLNIGVMGQVKAGKSSFLNTLLFQGEDILPKAATPKTAALTKIEYAPQNAIRVEYYSASDWAAIEAYAGSDECSPECNSAREQIKAARDVGMDYRPYLDKGEETLSFDSYEELLGRLNDYVGDNGAFTPIVKAATLQINKEEFKELSIVDTPGLNDPIESRTQRTREFMKNCDVVFFLTQTGQFLDESDWKLLSRQLPQNGVARIVLVGSKFDSGIRDVLRAEEPDDPFGGGDDTADNIPAACEMVRRKLTRRAKKLVDEYISRRGDVTIATTLEQCKMPVFISALAYDMAHKPVAEYDAEERNVYEALKIFSQDIQADLERLGNFDAVRELFDQAVREKEQLLEEKIRGLLPTSRAALQDTLNECREKAQSRRTALEKGSMDELKKRKALLERRSSGVTEKILTIFSDVQITLERKKIEVIQELRDASVECQQLKEHTGTETRTGSYEKRHFIFFKKTHYYTYDASYTYMIVSDAVEELNKFYQESAKHIDSTFIDALDQKKLRKDLLDTILQEFDVEDENFDASFMRGKVQELVNAITFPVFKMEIADEVNQIANQFSGEIRAKDEQNKLAVCLGTAVSRILNSLITEFEASVEKFKQNLSALSERSTTAILKNVKEEYDKLMADYTDKENILRAQKAYLAQLELELKKL